MKSAYQRGTLQLTTAADLKGNYIHENNLSLTLDDAWIYGRAFAVSICLNFLLSKITASLSPWNESVVPLIENYIEINPAVCILSDCIPFGLHSFHLYMFRKVCECLLWKILGTLRLRDLKKKGWCTCGRDKKWQLVLRCRGN